jgi:hypothetical protein
MIRARHTWIGDLRAKYYTKILLGFFFKRLNYEGEYEEKELPILMISNHFSFYDGWIQILLNLKIFKRKYHFMMLEEELRKNMHLTNVGACSIDKGKRSSLESLAYAVDILKDKRNLFLFFPQGKIESMYTQDFVFEKGLLSYILKKSKNDFQLVFNVNLINYGAKLKPDIFVYYETQHINSETTAEDVEIAFNRFAKACYTKQGVK